MFKCHRPIFPFRIISWVDVSIWFSYTAICFDPTPCSRVYQEIRQGQLNSSSNSSVESCRTSWHNQLALHFCQWGTQLQSDQRHLDSFHKTGTVSKMRTAAVACYGSHLGFVQKCIYWPLQLQFLSKCFYFWHRDRMIQSPKHVSFSPIRYPAEEQWPHTFDKICQWMQRIEWCGQNQMESTFTRLCKSKSPSKMRVT